MALVRRSGNQRRTLILLGSLAVAAVGTIYYLFFASEGGGLPGTIVDPITERTEADIRTIADPEKRLVTDLEALLKDKRFEELEQHGTLPVDVGSVGRDNPFEKTF